MRGGLTSTANKKRRRKHSSSQSMRESGPNKIGRIGKMPIKIGNGEGSQQSVTGIVKPEEL
tara:strand:+ start:757 stop:939 length:183 start_codon:yes stop_codon:yes gene_type:complete